MDIVTTEFQRRDNHPRQDNSKDRGKKRSFEDRIRLQAGSEDKKNNSGDKRDFVLQDQIDRGKNDRRCFKCGRKNHQATEYEYGCVYKMPALKYTSDPNREPVN